MKRLNNIGTALLAALALCLFAALLAFDQHHTSDLKKAESDRLRPKVVEVKVMYVPESHEAHHESCETCYYNGCSNEGEE